MKILFIIIFFYTLLSGFHCATDNTLDREIIPSDTLNTRNYNDKCALYIGRDMEISLQEVKENFVAEFLNNKLFGNAGTDYSKSVRQYFFFIVVISNTGNYPVELMNTVLKYENRTLKNLTTQDFKINNPGFHDSMFEVFQITSEDLCLKDTDFLKNIKKYEKPYIEPGNMVIKLLAFSRIPVQYRKFKISVTVKSDIIQKIVDFRLIRFEYRHSGNHFVRPEKNID